MTEAKERMAAMRERKRKEGLIRKELWVHPDRLKEFEKAKIKLREGKK